MTAATMMPLAQTATRTVFEWGRIQSNTDWLWPILALIGVALYVRWMYRRDSVELSPRLSWLLTTLRVLTFAALALIFLQPQRRTEREVTQPSRALLLADTSLSMGLSDEPLDGSGERVERWRQLIAALEESDFLNRLRRQHDVAVWRFDETAAPVARFEKRRDPPSADGGSSSESARRDDNGDAEPELDWPVALAPRGVETRLGEGLRELLDSHRGAPVSGVVLFSDGGQNAGVGPADASKLAREAGIAIHTVGIGSAKLPQELRLRDIVAPARVYPGDHFTATAYLQAQGMEGDRVTVELWSRPGDGDTAASEELSQLEGTETIVIPADGEVAAVPFELTPGEPGTTTLSVRIKSDRAAGETSESRQEVDVEVVDRQTRVLLFAGGPTREYQFLRTLLYRDPHVTIDVLLQTAQPGISQEADRIRDQFPSTLDDMFAYDAVIAIDPNWLALDEQQVDLLERWVGQQAGGLIVVAGPIHSSHWTQSAAMNKIRALYPVEFNRQFSLLDSDRFGSGEPWPIDFTRAGQEAEFLLLDESPTRSRRVWDRFRGVYGYFDVRGAKPGAVVYGTYSDPRAASGGEPPVYIAGQFYGSGRVLYFGSGELWRLRTLDPAYHERLATQIVRYVSQGRLLRGSSHGVVLLERDRYFLGQSVVIRAQLSGAQLEPLDVPRVELTAIAPDRSRQSVTLVADSTRPGAYSGQLTVRQEGTYRLELPVPETRDERISQRFQVRVPDLERENPQRNDALLSEIATSTGGRYFTSLEEALGEGDGVLSLLKDRSKTDVLSDAPRPLWDNTWVLLVVCGFLSVEWLIRRLVRLA